MTATAADVNNTPATNGADSSEVNHSQVAFMFVQEYYTFMNKDPHRLHCFYSKGSTMVHGLEGEVVDPHHGQQAIHTKIKELDFQDCKVRVLNVDALSSLNGGIIIQVLGEMSNKGGPSQKFSQTFFLAEQPKGYYVLNDIFRFIKDDVAFEDEEEYHEDDAQEAAAAEPEIPVVVPASEPVAEEPVPVQDTPAPAEEAKTEPEPVKEAPAATPAPVVAEEKKTEKKTDKRGGEKKGEKKTADKKEDTKEAKKEIKKEENAEKTAVATAIADAPAHIPVSAAPAAPAEPPKPKTWANLAANNSNQWGAHASTAKGASVTVTQPVAKPAAAPQQQQQQQQQQQSKPHREYHSIYVKNVTDKMTIEQLKEVFSQFGTVKHLELTSKKNNAFVDFVTADAVQAALKQHTVKVGSETVLAEERRRGGAPQAGGRPFHANGANGGVNGHRYDAKPGNPQGANRGGRGGSARGGPGDRKSINRPDGKPVATAAAAK